MLYNFANNGDGPSAFYHLGVLAQGQDGNVYTTSFAGGFSTDPYAAGAFFNMTPAGVLNLLCPFENNPNDPNTGATPRVESRSARTEIFTAAIFFARPETTVRCSR